MKKILVFVLLLVVSLGVVCAVDSPAKRTVIWGYTFDPMTGFLFNADGDKQPFTFEPAFMWGPNDKGELVITNMNPLEFATVATAAASLEFAKSQDSGEFSLAEIKPTFPNVIWGWNVPQRYVVHCGEKFNAGLIANSRIREGDFLASQSLKAEFVRACSAK